ncbi:5-deoxy-glucuronate isomerase [Flavihumibacter cheonanensis]|uniref:5-deoxy-glucuronate isomerase n=1 Tax=Flavihumibacter cheonanensis TaxID=1442385 RepID=UPI001EF847B8|nr:5-deoxy-glucuronate isomerase [Flavihumibacter cheonanensis]MCG7752011.1 5-deoxy-glucuronate isomerase [Flavihumibacter cheonanensis]
MKNLLIHPNEGASVYQRITAADAGWEHLNMEARLLKKGESWTGYTGEDEYGFILLSGNYTVTTNHGTWTTSNGRKSVFSGIAHSLYLPRHTEFKLTATSELLDIAAGWVKAKADYPARFKTPEEAAIEIRGGENATRQINSLIEPGFGCSSLVAVEVYTPSGNWSSFPAHKHDVRVLDANGELKEADLEEIYFYKIDKPGGFALQQVYTSDRSLDEILRAGNNDAVLVPEGYHPVVALHGYNCYYLNFLAGSDQSLANTPDPDHNWLFDSWTFRDPRIPMVTAEMNNQP